MCGIVALFEGQSVGNYSMSRVLGDSLRGRAHGQVLDTDLGHLPSRT